jgi:hypothetical protein
MEFEDFYEGIERDLKEQRNSGISRIGMMSIYEAIIFREGKLDEARYTFYKAIITEVYLLRFKDDVVSESLDNLKNLGRQSKR